MLVYRFKDSDEKLCFVCFKSSFIIFRKNPMLAGLIFCPVNDN